MARKKSLSPQRLRMTRAARLQAARAWLPKFEGKNVVRGYARWFGVNLGCALKELRKLGVPLDPVYVERLLTTLRNRSRPRREAAPAPPTSVRPGYGIDWNDEFAYIAGFTNWGFPFGVRWEELAESEAEALRGG